MNPNMSSSKLLPGQIQIAYFYYSDTEIHKIFHAEQLILAGS